MSAGLEQVCRIMADYLTGRGVPAAVAWPASPKAEAEGVLAVVSLRGCRALPGSFGDYLGEGWDEEAGLWREGCGRRAELTLGLDLCAPGRGGGQALQRAFDRLAAALLLGGPAGLEVQELSCGPTAYDPDSRRLVRPAEVRCLTWLRAVADSGGALTDFELRGVAKT